MPGIAPSQAAAASSKSCWSPLFRQPGVFRHADELRVCAEAARIDAVDVVTGLEQGDACATCFDRPGQFAADAGFSWSDQIA